MRHGTRTSGIAVDPARVRAAREEAGLSLAQVAGDDVSRTFLHLVEHGRSRPSLAVLSLIAKRTGRPVSYFVARTTEKSQVGPEIAGDLVAVAAHIRQLISSNGLDPVDQEAMKLLELTVRQGAQLAKAVQRRSGPKRRQ